MDIGGNSVIDDTRASLRFMSDGKLTGHGTCNRIIGSFEGQE